MLALNRDSPSEYNHRCQITFHRDPKKSKSSTSTNLQLLFYAGAETSPALYSIATRICRYGRIPSLRSRSLLSLTVLIFCLWRSLLIDVVWCLKQLG
jgi:hypothetical protein